MKKILYLFLVLPLIFTSCSKEDEVVTPTVITGCTDATANNYNSSATENDGSCTYDVAGCTDNTAYNYDPSANTDDGSCEYVGQVLFYLGYQIPGEIWDTYGENSVYFDLGDENSLNTGIFLAEVGDLSTVTSLGNIIAPLCSEASDVILINVLTPEFGSQTYTWRVRNWLSLEVYDYGTFSVSKNDCVKVGVDLVK